MRAPACREWGYRPFGTKGGHALLHCAACGTIYSGTRPCEEALDELYEHYYDRASFELHPVTGAALDRLARSFSAFRSTNRWLDVGFGAGGLLTVAERHGWLCHGVEVAPAALQHGAVRGWTVADNLDDSRFPTAGFDVVTMIELIEHVTTPDAFFAPIARRLRPGGVLLVTTPNAQSLNRRLLGLDWSVIAPPEHLTIWSAKGLCRSLRRAGFVPFRIRAEGLNPSELRTRICPLRPGAPPVNRNAAAVALNEAFSRSLPRRSFKSVINCGLSLIRAGDRLKVWATLKPGSSEL